MSLISLAWFISSNYGDGGGGGGGFCLLAYLISLLKPHTVSQMKGTDVDRALSTSALCLPD